LQLAGADRKITKQFNILGKSQILETLEPTNENNLVSPAKVWWIVLWSEPLNTLRQFCH